MKLLETPHGPACVHLREVDDPFAALVLGHGAGGGVESPDLQGATKAAPEAGLAGAARAALEAGLAVALVEQPYRVAGRRTPAPANQLDAAWISVIEQLAFEVPLIVGGRPSGARVACRTAAETGAAAVLCLAFPVHPPGRPEKSRLAELDAVTVPTLVVQGARDPFGMPPKRRGRTMVAVKGTHSLASDREGVRAAITAFLGRLLAS